MFGLSLKEKIIKKYYRDYPEVPYISNERPADWLEKSQLFPQMIVKRKNMERYPDGLLPGHIYMLYWLKENKEKHVPEYFEYDFGIDFKKEKRFLFDHGYIDVNGSVTSKGDASIQLHYDVIEYRKPSPKKTGSFKDSSVVFINHGRIIDNALPAGKSILKKSDYSVILDELNEVNQAIRQAEELAGVVMPLRLLFKEIDLRNAFYCFTPVSGTKQVKYPLVLRFCSESFYRTSNADSFICTFKYFASGIIGDANIVFWRGHKGYKISIRTKKRCTYIYEFEETGPDKLNGWKILYKAATTEKP
ncbi:MAG: hypothetical protein ACI4W2_00115 [Eubacterium sp.]